MNDYSGPNLFGFTKLNETGMEAAKEISEAFVSLIHQLGDHCTEGREFSIVKTKLEEACFYAKKSMSANLSLQDHGVQENTTGEVK